jgi:outer membrane lipoprotein-sorting protein
MGRRLRYLLPIVLPTVLAVCITAAHAYVLHGSHILQMMSDAIGKADSLRVVQKHIVYRVDQQEAPIELDEVVLYDFPDAYRSEISSRSGERIHVFSRGSSITIIDRRVVADGETVFDRYMDLFLCNSRVLFEQRLPQMGIDPSISSLGRFQGRIGYVLGARYPDESVPQLWVDKKTFRPFRWLIRPGADTNGQLPVEVRFYGWRKAGKYFYPMRIEFYQKDTLIRSLQVGQVQPDLALAADLFDIRRLRSTYPAAVKSPAPEQSATGDKSEVQKTLDDFRKIFE